MKFGVFKDSIEDALSDFDKMLLNRYRDGEILDIFNYYEDNGHVDAVNVACDEISFCDINLRVDAADAHETDYDNVVMLHSKMKSMPRSFMSRPEFWALMCHENFSDYIRYRSETAPEKYTEETIRRDYFCQISSGVRRSLITNPLSRLWWAGELLCDPDRLGDEYHFVRIFTKNAFNSNMMLLASSTAPNNPTIARGILDAIEQWLMDTHTDVLRRKDLVACTKYLNSIGAVRMVDTLTRAEIKELCYSRIEKANEEDQIGQL